MILTFGFLLCIKGLKSTVGIPKLKSIIVDMYVYFFPLYNLVKKPDSFIFNVLIEIVFIVHYVFIKIVFYFDDIGLPLRIYSAARGCRDSRCWLQQRPAGGGVELFSHPPSFASAVLLNGTIRVVQEVGQWRKR